MGDEEDVVKNSTKAVEDYYKEEIAPHRATLERWYCENQSTVNDLLIMVITILVVVWPQCKLYNSIWRKLPEN